MFNRQEVFDLVCTHLINQSAKSMGYSDGNGCMYRGLHGMMCAAGCLIPDELYHKKMEGRSVSGVNEDTGVFDKVFDCKMTTEDIEFLRALQNVHDSNAVAVWAVQLRRVASNYKLTWNTKYGDFTF